MNALLSRCSGVLLACTALACGADETAQRASASASVTPTASSAGAPAPPAQPAPSGAASTAAAPPGPPCPRGMALVPAATFVVGAATKAAIHRGSPTRVEAFCIDRLEVTTAAYEACMTAGACTAPLHGGSCTHKRAGAQQKPINCVGFEQAAAYCKHVEKRLPLEAEWESAAGAGKRMYPWGHDPPGKLVCWDGKENALGYGKRHDSCDVGTFSGDVTPQGVLDLGGNVTEWTASLDAPEAVIGPPRPKDPNQREARRGGSWGTKNGPFLLRTTSRRVGDFHRYDAGIFTGFRCARDEATPAR